MLSFRGRGDVTWEDDDDVQDDRQQDDFDYYAGPRGWAEAGLAQEDPDPAEAQAGEAVAQPAVQEGGGAEGDASDDGSDDASDDASVPG